MVLLIDAINALRDFSTRVAKFSCHRGPHLRDVVIDT